VRALESVLAENGYVDPAALDVLIETYEIKVGPHNGARVIAKAWSDPDYRRWLPAIGSTPPTAHRTERRSTSHRRGSLKPHASPADFWFTRRPVLVSETAATESGSSRRPDSLDETAGFPTKRKPDRAWC
jgi:hypothetical protein